MQSVGFKVSGLEDQNLPRGACEAAQLMLSFMDRPGFILGYRLRG